MARKITRNYRSHFKQTPIQTLHKYTGLLSYFLITPFECHTFSKKIIRTTEYEITFKLVCAGQLIATGNNCGR